MPLCEAPGTPSSRRSSAPPRSAPRVPVDRAPPASPRPAAPRRRRGGGAAAAHRHRRAGPRPGRRPGRRLGRAAGRRAGIGKSTLLLQAAAGIAAGRGDAAACSTPPARSRPGRSGCGRRAWGCWTMPPARRSASSPRPRWGGSSSARGPNGRRCSSSTRCRRSARTSSMARRAPSGQVREATLRLMELAKGEGVAGRARRPRHEGRHARRPQDPGAPRRRRAHPGRRPHRRRSGSCARRRTASGPPRRSACSRWASRGSTSSPTRPARSSPSTTARRPGSVVAPTLEGSRPLLVEVQALVAAVGVPVAAADRLGHRPEPAGAPRRGARPARRASAWARTTSTRTSPAASPSPSPAWTCRWRSRSPRRSGTGRWSPATVAIGEVGLLGELRPVSGLERRLREAARLGFEQAIVPPVRRAAATSPTSPGCASARRPRCARRSACALGGAPEPRPAPVEVGAR